MIDIIVGDDPQNTPVAGKTAVPASSSKAVNSSSALPSDKKMGDRDSRKNAGVLFVCALLIYAVLASLSINHKYVDFGDGNYLYLSWQLSQGKVLYKDLPCPQPPLLLFLGAGLLKLTNGDPALIRLWQVFQHVLTACCIWGIAARLFRRTPVSSLAGIIYLFLPEGVWWAAGYQSEPLLILLQSINLFLLISAMQENKGGWMLYAAGFLAALECYTNMTALPYVGLQWFFVWFRFRRFFVRYSLSLLIPGTVIFVAMWFYTHGVYLEHVFFRQVGTYPHKSLSGTIFYFLGKLYSEGGDILFFEGGFVIASLFGILLYSGEECSHPLQEYILWWAIFSLGSIVFVTKGGTVEYIFTLGEPAVAIFSAYFLLTMFAASGLSFEWRDLRDPLGMGKGVLIVCLFLPVMLMKPFSLLYRSFGNGSLNFPGVMEERGVFELSDAEMEKARLYIEKYCPSNKMLISPPYYAFLAKREIADDSSELFILWAAYYSDWDRLSHSRSLDFTLPRLEDATPFSRKERNETDGFTYELRYNTQGTYYNTQSVYDLAALFDKEPNLKQEYPAIALFLDLRKKIMNKEVGLIVKNMEHSFFYVPPLHQAIRDFCTPVDPQIKLENREEKIVFYQPKY